MKAIRRDNVDNDFTFLRWLRWRHAGVVVLITLLLEWTVGIYWHLQKPAVAGVLPSSMFDWRAASWISVLFGGLSVILPVFLYALLLVVIGCGVTRMANEQWAPARGPTIWFVALSLLFTLIVSHAAYTLLTRGQW